MSLHDDGAMMMFSRNNKKKPNKKLSTTRAAKRPHRRKQLSLEQLETRVLMAGDLRTFDGSGNNLANPQWGSARSAFVRTASAAYGDGLSSPNGADLPHARLLSNRLMSQGTQDLINNRNMSQFVNAWRQFIDNDIEQARMSGNFESFPIKVPTGDPSFDPSSTGTKTLTYMRSEYDPLTGRTAGNPRQQTNAVSSFIDASQVYGTTRQRADALRTFAGGKLNTSTGNLLPMNTMNLENASLPGTPASSYFLAGDPRANETIQLTAMQTLFMREHNRLADKFAATNPTWSDEQIYQAARRWVSAELQVITYNEFLPQILGPTALTPYQGYKATVNPSISNEFATAAFQFGNSTSGKFVRFLNDQGRVAQTGLTIQQTYFAPQVIQQNGIDTLLKYLASDRSQEVDLKVVDELRSFLFGPPGSSGIDVAATTIQRGRDHGLANYNATRIAYGLPRVTTFAEITSNAALQQSLQNNYGTVDKIDLWVGGLAEKHLPGSSFGPLFTRIIADQFQRLRDGDRFWYEREFQGQELTDIRATTLAGVIQNNTTISNLQAKVFEFRAEIVGRVITDANANGVLETGERGMSGVVVQLQNTRGVVIATTTTNSLGQYRFQKLNVGNYRIRIVMPTGYRMTTRLPIDVAISKGMLVNNVDFGLATI
jgi:peroxidase